MHLTPKGPGPVADCALNIAFFDRLRYVLGSPQRLAIFEKLTHELVLKARNLTASLAAFIGMTSDRKGERNDPKMRLVSVQATFPLRLLRARRPWYR